MVLSDLCFVLKLMRSIALTRALLGGGGVKIAIAMVYGIFCLCFTAHEFEGCN